MNYYARGEKEKKCEVCKHHPESIHLGKSSGGWQFSFQYNRGEFYKNVEEMKEWLADKEIEDEYGAPVSHDNFWEMVAEKQKPENLNHAQMMHKDYPSHTGEYIIDGYSFSDCTFS